MPFSKSRQLVITALLTAIFLFNNLSGDLKAAGAGRVSNAMVSSGTSSAEALLLSLLPDSAQERTGTPWQGRGGIVETTRQAMQREAVQSKETPSNQNSQPRLHPRQSKSGLKLRMTGQDGKETNVAPEPSIDQTGKGVASSFNSPASTGVSRNSPQSVGAGFTGATLSDSQTYPPDTMGAVGPSQFLVAINGRLRTFNKQTGLKDNILDVSTNNFFAPVMTPGSGNFTANPRVRFDRLSQRWFLLMIDVPGGQALLPNRILLAVSGSADITAATTWTKFYFRQDQLTPVSGSDEFTDFPTLGIDANALYIGANIYTPAGFNTAAFVVRKSSVLGSGPVVVTAFKNLIDETGNGPDTPQGVDNFDSGASQGYFLGTAYSEANPLNQLVLLRVSNPAATPTLSDNISIPVAATAYPIKVPHAGNTGGSNGNLDPVSDALTGAMIRNGRLWTAQNIGVDATGAASNSATRDATRWYELQDLSNTPGVRQWGTLFDGTTSQKSYWVPSIAVSGQGHAALGFSVAGPTDFINAGTAGRLQSDTPDTMQTPLLLTSSSADYNPPGDPGGAAGRYWGNYSYTSLDPTDDMTFWTIQEFTDTANSYGVYVAKLLAPPPASNLTANPATVPVGQNSVDITITGESTSGSGFFDPGDGFAGRLSALATGGVTVNSTTYISPTQLVVNISTPATAGSASLTVTNPDGQSVSGPNVLTITGGGGDCVQAVTTAADDNSTGSLRSAVIAAGASGNCKTVSLENAPSPLILSSSLDVPAGVSITTNKTCSAGKIEIKGNGFSGSGLTLNGGTFSGLYIHDFSGPELVTKKGRNILNCVRVDQT